MTFFAEGATRNSSRWDLYSLLGDAGFLCADGMITLLEKLVRQLAVLGKSDAHDRCHRPPLSGFSGQCVGMGVTLKCDDAESDSRVDRESLSQLPRLRFVATRSTGYDHIDLAACQERGILVSNVPTYGETP